jgi:hypothetical protein
MPGADVLQSVGWQLLGKHRVIRATDKRCQLYAGHLGGRHVKIHDRNKQRSHSKSQRLTTRIGVVNYEREPCWISNENGYAYPTFKATREPIT